MWYSATNYHYLRIFIDILQCLDKIDTASSVQLLMKVFPGPKWKPTSDVVKTMLSNKVGEKTREVYAQWDEKRVAEDSGDRGSEFWEKERKILSFFNNKCTHIAIILLEKKESVSSKYIMLSCPLLFYMLYYETKTEKQVSVRHVQKNNSVLQVAFLRSCQNAEGKEKLLNHIIFSLGIVWWRKS